MARNTSHSPRRSKELGIDDTALPGGLQHIGNAETHVSKVPVPAHRHIPAMNEHGVPDADPDKSYELPEAGRVLPPKYVRAKTEEYHAVPTYNVQHPDKTPTHRMTLADVITVPGNTAVEPIRICSVDYDRVEVQLLNEDPANDIRVSEERSALLEGKGAILKHGALSYTKFTTQDTMYAYGTTASPVMLSVAITTEINNGG